MKNGTASQKEELLQRDGKYYLVLDPVNSYYRRIFYQEIASVYGETVTVVKLDEDNQVFPAVHLDI